MTKAKEMKKKLETLDLAYAALGAVLNCQILPFLRPLLHLNVVLLFCYDCGNGCLDQPEF